MNIPKCGSTEQKVSFLQAEHFPFLLPINVGTTLPEMHFKWNDGFRWIPLIPPSTHTEELPKLMLNSDTLKKCHIKVDGCWKHCVLELWDLNTSFSSWVSPGEGLSQYFI